MALMLHTLVGDSDDEVRDIVRGPMKRYLGSSLDLASGYVKSVPFLKNTAKAASNCSASPAWFSRPRRGQRIFIGLHFLGLHRLGSMRSAGS